jgi:hypothetical protein
MSNVDLARWQFAFTSVNHFLFVPVTIGLAFLTAFQQAGIPAVTTAGHTARSTAPAPGKPGWRRLASRTRKLTEEAGKRHSTSHAVRPEIQEDASDDAV